MLPNNRPRLIDARVPLKAFWTFVALMTGEGGRSGSGPSASSPLRPMFEEGVPGLRLYLHQFQVGGTSLLVHTMCPHICDW